MWQLNTPLYLRSSSLLENNGLGNNKKGGNHQQLLNSFNGMHKFGLRGCDHGLTSVSSTQLTFTVKCYGNYLASVIVKTSNQGPLGIDFHWTILGELPKVCFPCLVDEIIYYDTKSLFWAHSARVHQHCNPLKQHFTHFAQADFPTFAFVSICFEYRQTSHKAQLTLVFYKVKNHVKQF